MDKKDKEQLTIFSLDNSLENFKFTKASKDGQVDYIEREVKEFNFNGFQVVRREFFSKATCPAVTFKFGSVIFNLRAIKKLDECEFIKFLMHPEKPILVIKPGFEDEKDAMQWCRKDKRNKTVPRKIIAKDFTAKLYNDMNWTIDTTHKVLGTFFYNKKEKVFAFELINAEAYKCLSEPLSDDPKRRKRVPYMPEHWKDSYGLPYEESQKPLITTFDGAPPGFVKIIIPKLPKRGKKEDSDGSDS